MPQPAHSEPERRRDHREPKAFALWLRSERNVRCVSAWMLDLSAGGAALLTPFEKAPPIGDRIQLLEMPTHDPLVRDGAPPLPMFARVLRHDDSRGLTRRIAVRFEAEQVAPREDQEMAPVAVSRPQSAVGGAPLLPVATGLPGQLVR